jgi:hypothetical protein
MVVVSVFPACSALFAAAASVSKARCEVQSEAAVQAASTMALEYSSDNDEDPILRPFRGVIELIQLTYRSSIRDPMQKFVRRLRKMSVFQIIDVIIRRNKSASSEDEPSPKPAMGLS